jgi:hypothetical protein
MNVFFFFFFFFFYIVFVFLVHSLDDLLSKTKGKRKDGEQKRKKNRAVRSGTRSRKNCTNFDQILEIEVRY